MGNRELFYKRSLIFRSILLLIYLTTNACDKNEINSDESLIPDFTATESITMDYGQMWCSPVYDGEQLVVSTESGGEIFVGSYSLDLTLTTSAVKVAGKDDTNGGDNIADHKHIFQNDHHYLTFSTSGTGQGGYLYLMKLNRNLERVSLVNVVSDAPPTNDMFLVGDGSSVHVGKFLPGMGHELYTFDGNLNLEGSETLGGEPNRHANGASAIYTNNEFYLVAPDTLAPGENSIFSRIVYDSNWSAVQNKKTILTDTNMLGLMTGLSLEPLSETFIIHYTRSDTDAGGDLYRGIYSSSWDELDNQKVESGAFQRPHTLIVGDQLFLGYEIGDFSLRLASYQITIPTAE